MQLAIVGLPASGKTTLGMKLSEENGVPYFDDIQPYDVLPENFIISSPFFCIENAQNLLRSRFPSITFIYFSNNPTQCLVNSKHRDRNVAGSIRQLSRVYTPVNPIPVFGEEL